jgi:hypothetical protein
VIITTKFSVVTFLLVLLLVPLIGIQCPNADAAQSPMQWNKTYSGLGGIAIQTSDGGYAITEMNATILFYPATQRTPVLTKTDTLGTLQWSITYELSGVADINAILQTSDGGYLISGSSILPPVSNPVYSGWLLKTSKDGDVEWTKTYGAIDSCHVTQVADGNFVLVGSIANSFNGVDFAFIKTDSQGNVLWDKTERGSQSLPNVLLALDVVGTSDGGIAVAGSSKRNFWFMKTDSEGVAEFNKTYATVPDSSAVFMLRSVSETSDGGYILAGLQGSTAVHDTGNFAWLIKTDSDGNMVWNRSYYSGTTGFSSAVQLVDKGYAAVGAYNKQAIVVRTDSSGQLLYNESYGTSNADKNSYALSVVPTVDGGFAVSGTLDSYLPSNAEGYKTFPASEKTVWLAKFGAETIPSQSESTSPEKAPSPNLSFYELVGSAAAVSAIVVAGLFVAKRRKKQEGL